MQSENRPLIVIPLHKKIPSDSEVVSLQRVLTVLPKYDFSIACPKSLDIAGYLNYFERADLRVLVERFEDSYFQSEEGYNHLMLTTEFYSRFDAWKYIIIYQLDCFIFKDEIKKWVTADYDYVGAPWFNHEQPLNFYKSLVYSKWKIIELLKRSIDFNKGEKIYVGNGGLSLRKVEKFKNILKVLKLVFKRHLRGHIHEDYIWSILVTKYFSDFKVPSAATASRFALEEIKEPINLDSLESLPMACHAWERYYPELWKSLVMKFDK